MLKREEILSINQKGWFILTQNPAAPSSLPENILPTCLCVMKPVSQTMFSKLPIWMRLRGFLHTSWKEAEIVILHRKLSTYLNAMAQSGLVLEQIIESEPNVSLARKPEFVPEKWYSVPRAQLLLTRFIEKATKPIFLHG